jgi:hypothetical protein
METSNRPRVSWPIVALVLALVTAVLMAGYFVFSPVRIETGENLRVHRAAKQKQAQQSAAPATH